MKKLLLLISLLLSFQVAAAPTNHDGEITDEQAEVSYMTMGEFFQHVEENEPELYEWCIAKASLAIHALEKREEVSRTEKFKVIEETQKVVPTYKAIELTRIINDVYRLNAKGGWRIANTEEQQNKIYKKEFQNCLINEF